jgi:hypothetical protein
MAGAVGGGRRRGVSSRIGVGGGGARMGMGGGGARIDVGGGGAKSGFRGAKSDLPGCAGVSGLSDASECVVTVSIRRSGTVQMAEDDLVAAVAQLASMSTDGLTD